MNQKVYFSGLDGLRFISISFVVLHHLLTFKNYYGLTHFDFPVIGLIGYYGIQFFFAGSGFLITYLLLTERARSGSISLSRFFVRRILRIWPAYLFLVLLALLVLLQSDFFSIPGLTPAYLAGNYHRSNALYFTMLPHLAPFVNSTAPYVHQTYTIGIEEQFYFLWGFLFFIAARFAKPFFWILVFTIPFFNFLHGYLLPIAGENSNGLTTYFLKATTFLQYCRFSTFAIGGLLAYAFFSGAKWLNVFRRVPVQLLVYALLIASIAFDISIPYLRDEWIAVLTLAVFVIATFPKESMVNYEAPWLAYLGRISYGIYLFHIFAIVFAIKICRDVLHLQMTNWTELALLIIIAFIIAIFFGWISYQVIEKFFLRLKRRFMKVPNH